MSFVRVANQAAVAIEVSASVLPSSCALDGVPSPPCSQAEQDEVSSFLVQGDCAHLEPGSSCSLSVTFSPTSARKLTAYLMLQSNASFVGQVELSGTGIPESLVSGTVLAVEFYNQQLDHYFLTELPNEIEKLDSGAISGWQRTGYSFWVWPNAATAATGTSPTCRFYGLPAAGLNSHFYSASNDECAAVLSKFPQSWLLESPDLFFVYLPNTNTGECPAGSSAVYRLYNNRADANHRYLPLQTLDWLNMRLAGWIPEGYGPNAVALCSAPAVFNGNS